MNLSCEEIDEAINRDYNNDEKWEYVLKSYTGEDGKKHSYWTVEDANKKEKKSKGLIKSLLKK